MFMVRMITEREMIRYRYSFYYKMSSFKFVINQVLRDLNLLDNILFIQVKVIL